MAADIAALQYLAFYAVLCVLCFALTLIDVRRRIIPDALNLSIGCLGLAKVVVTSGATASIEAAAEGVATGLIFWILRRVYLAVRKNQGLGLGDVKFLAAAA